MGIFDSIADRGRELAGFDPGAWTALAAWVAIVIVVVALIYAWRQYLKARERRNELTQPNVSMFMEPSSSDWHLVELVVRNYGRRPAYGLRFEFANPPTVGKYESSYDDNFVDITPLNLPAEIPYLAPSQEWRTVWDSALDRKQLGEAIASRFDGAITYYDEPPVNGKPSGNKFRNTAVLDWATLPPVDRMELLTTHDRARQEKQKLELLRGLLAYYQYAAKETDEQTLRSEINRIKALGNEVRERWRSRYEVVDDDEDDDDFDDDDPATDLINPPVRTGRRHRAD
ncbi:hypothetical protein [Mycolicibacterium goodii]|uniref:hypothetical protein n=1 Tax=Mycolicibacterium goodii TaxID=134601 RepID=UPI000C260D65|nr:hypothetical protein [Mycolicibacterium goodii]MBU8809515.1 hypothetical protein [Mycolicibacterium goodii]MBU8830516.1 hypothetical protein [Mycolicibacterium goodii]PJK24156.1 hypothetical protein CSX11_01330 [Mycolicibacterium goodii]ULN48932.1 hypothetical protein MI170_06035 [Mycolicibacterium goodii]